MTGAAPPRIPGITRCNMNREKILTVEGDEESTVTLVSCFRRRTNGSDKLSAGYEAGYRSAQDPVFHLSIPISAAKVEREALDGVHLNLEMNSDGSLRIDGEGLSGEGLDALTAALHPAAIADLVRGLVEQPAEQRSADEKSDLERIAETLRCALRSIDKRLPSMRDLD